MNKNSARRREQRHVRLSCSYLTTWSNQIAATKRDKQNLTSPGPTFSCYSPAVFRIQTGTLRMTRLQFSRTVLKWIQLL